MKKTLTTITVTFTDKTEDVLYSTEVGARFFYRHTGTYGAQGDPGYVLIENQKLADFFTKLEKAWQGHTPILA